jgi:16S rRNA pseudouridine516 synthase
MYGEFMAKLRLDKYLADMKVGTRSEVKDYIRKKKVKVNGEIIAQSDYKIDTEHCLVNCNGLDISYAETEYYMLNKPAGVLSAASDAKAKTVVDLIINRQRKDLFPVGRLDKDTEGLILISNDGELAHRMLTPKKHVDKVYEAVVLGNIASNVIDQFAQGLFINDDFTALPAKLDILETNFSYTYTDEDGQPRTDISSKVRITIHEGKFHQIKKMFEAVNSKVLYLKRISMGPLVLDETLLKGQYRPLTPAEKQALLLLK